MERLLSAEINGFNTLSGESQIIKVFPVAALTLESFVRQTPAVAITVSGTLFNPRGWQSGPLQN